jgi:epoxyqueuosine reductase
MPISTSELTAKVRERAFAEGFDVVRITKAVAPAGAGERLRAFLGAGRHGDMGWMAANADRRADPAALWPEARTVIMLGTNYGPDQDPRDDLGIPDRGTISVYARGEDYHDLIKARLKRLGHWLCDNHGGDARVFVDTAPVLEKALAEQAGIGWQGKHTNLVSRDFGSWLFLGSVFTSLELDADDAALGHCGACHACLDICPTRAFAAPYQLDARRCISYLTIEHKGHIPPEFREAIGNRIYGCDDCLAVCPWNKFARISHEAALAARSELVRPHLRDLVRLDDAAFRALFRKSPVKRIGRDRFVRNVLIAIGNSGDAALAQEAIGLLNDASPLVRAMAVWALSRLLVQAEFAAVAAIHATSEADADVRGEWLR